MSIPSFLRVQGDGVLIHIRAQPRASRNEIGEAMGDELKVRIAALPVDSEANDALVRFLAKALGRPRNSVQIVRGLASRHKVVAVQGISPGEAAGRLTPGNHD